MTNTNLSITGIAYTDDVDSLDQLIEILQTEGATFRLIVDDGIEEIEIELDNTFTKIS